MLQIGPIGSPQEAVPKSSNLVSVYHDVFCVDGMQAMAFSAVPWLCVTF